MISGRFVIRTGYARRLLSELGEKNLLYEYRMGMAWQPFPF